MKKLIITTICLFALAFVGCASKAVAPAENYADLSAYPLADMSGYNCSSDYKGEYQFRSMTVAEVVEEMDAGANFVLFTGFNDCPWCNAILNHLNDIALERGIQIAYIDTRADPSWNSNTDITDYDLFVERFGNAIPEDDKGVKHLYVPHAFFVSQGAVIHDHAGTVSGQESPSDPLSREQLNEYRSLINGYIDDIIQ